MKIIKLVPEPPRLKQCAAIRQGKYWIEKGNAPFQCKHNGTYIINGYSLCKKHAGCIALANLLGEDWKSLLMPNLKEEK